MLDEYPKVSIQRGVRTAAKLACRDAFNRSERVPETGLPIFN
jgi:hypothetical protein